MSSETNKPSGWVLLCGLKDFYKPDVTHPVEGVLTVVNRWATSRIHEWSKLAPELATEGDYFNFSWSKGRICFLSDSLKDHVPVNGFMLYGASSFTVDITLRELSFLGGSFLLFFGQLLAEIHVDGKVGLLEKDNIWKP
jgi:hypothetical protein